MHSNVMEINVHDASTLLRAMRKSEKYLNQIYFNRFKNGGPDSKHQCKYHAPYGCKEDNELFQFIENKNPFSIVLSCERELFKQTTPPLRFFSLWSNIILKLISNKQLNLFLIEIGKKLFNKDII